MRQIFNIDKGWKFTKDSLKAETAPSHPGVKWKNIDIPHTWNAFDGQDGGFDYYRGKCWYMTAMEIHLDPNEDAYLEFLGAEAVAEVYVNDQKVCTHKGGFSTFRCNITSYIKHHRARIAVSVDNSESNEVYPQTADFTFFGGLYRSANLIITDKCHFDLDYFGGSGVKVTPVLNEDGTADVNVKVFTKNLDEDCETVIETAGCKAVLSQNETEYTFKVDNPHLWNGRKDPFLYDVVAKITRKGKVLDNVEQRYGIRSYKIDPQKGFFLNGEPYPLHGVARHQDRENMGWAISENEHCRDMELISEIGANSIRLAHYQHSQTFYDLCDSYGMIVWAEIPFISSFISGEAARKNTISQMSELIVQNYNHPSIICWGIANEITIGGDSSELIDNLNALNDLCHELDATRLTTIANLSTVENDSELNKITDIVAYNHYFGWYMGSVDENGPWLDKFHSENPDVCLGLSEYGCEGIVKYHNDEPKVQDYSEEYQAFYHEKMLETFADRKYLWATYAWNMFDFASDMRDEGGVKGRNNKGLVTYDRETKKDSFFIYKAYWNKDESFVHICSKRYVNRAAETTDIKVYSNCDNVTLEVDGKKIDTISGQYVFIFKDVPLKKGVNTMKAFSDGCQDFAEFNCVDEADEGYVLATKNTGANASNWFDELTVDEAEAEFREDCFSVKDKIGDIMKNPEGEKFIASVLEKASAEMNINISKGMMSMAKNFTVQKVFDMAGDRLPENVKLWANSQLQKIEKN